MASTFSLTSQSYEGRYLRLECSQTKNIAANKSQITWTLSSIGGIEKYYATGPTTITIGGTTVYYSGRVAWDSYKFPAATGSISGTVDIYHDNVGAKTIEVVMTTAIYYGTARTVRGNWALDDIPRASQPSCITYPQTTEYVGVLGSSFHIHMNSADGSFRHAIYYWRHDKWNLIASNVENNYLWTTPVDFANDVPNSMEYAGTIAVDTWSGSTFIGTKTVNFKAGVPEYYPTGSVAVSGNNLHQGVYVEGKSSATVNISADSSYRATIKSITSTIDEKTYTDQTFTTPALSKGAKSVRTVIVDSRGRSATIWSTEFGVAAYSQPWITSFSIERQTDRATVIARLQGGVSPIDNKNTKGFSVTLNGITQSIAADGYEVDGTTTFTNVPTDNTLVATAKISDYYTAAIKEATLPTVDVTLDFHHSGKGIAMGKVAEHEELLDVAWEIKSGKPAETLHGFSYRGSNPVLTDKDVDAYGWAKQGNLATVLFTKDSTLPNQPTDYGLLLNVTNGGAEVHQIWLEQPGGTVLHRGANAAGFTVWKKFLDDSNCPDYVVEQGTSGIWTYRKWASGVAECWGTRIITDVKLDQAWESLYYAETPESIAYPFEFADVPTETVMMGSNGMSSWTATATVNTARYTGKYFLMRPNAAATTTYTVYMHYQVKGKWK